MKRAIDNGLTVDELIEAITHLAFYAGWPSAMTAITTAKELFDHSDSSVEAGPAAEAKDARSQ
jgi:4-carboxymuconolactone decarboxylase